MRGIGPAQSLAIGAILSTGILTGMSAAKTPCPAATLKAKNQSDAQSSDTHVAAPAIQDCRLHGLPNRARPEHRGVTIIAG
jgi:hypothetical protein